MIRDQDHNRSDANAFQAWRRTVNADLKRAAALLGKSKRIVEYYEAGRPIPVDTRKLMRAIVERGADIEPWPEMTTGSRP